MDHYVTVRDTPSSPPGRRRAPDLPAAGVAGRDPDTGLPNRSRMLSLVTEAQRRTRAECAGRLVIVLLVDLHDATPPGGRTHTREAVPPRQVATALRSAVRHGDTVGHLGNGRFAVLLRDMSCDADAATLTEQIRTAMTSRTRPGGEPPSCTVEITMGSADRPAHHLLHQTTRPSRAIPGRAGHPSGSARSSDDEDASLTPEELRHELRGLRRAMQTRATIDRAIGILIERLRCTPDEAFAVLARTSQNTNRKLYLIAVDLVNRALAVPTPPAQRPRKRSEAPLASGSPRK